MSHSLLRLISAAMFLAVAATTLAQDAQPNPAAPGAIKQTTSINYRERPRYPFDSQRLRGRPVIDGKLGETEWAPLYTVGEGAAKGTAYLSWDDEFLYVAARAESLSHIAIDIDANGDGWLRGSDNLEMVISPVANGAAGPISVRLLDAASNRDAPVWNDKIIDPAQLSYAAQPLGAGQFVEVAIPKGLAGIRPRANATLSVRVDFAPSVPEKTAPYEPHLLVDVTLVDERATTTAGLTPRLTLDDKKLIPGQPLKATLEITNQVDDVRTIKSVSWDGEGPAVQILKSLREVNLPTLNRLKSVKLPYTSVIPENAIPGFYNLTVTAQLDNGAVLSNTVSFQVVEAFSVDLEFKEEPLTVNGPTEARLWVVVGSAVRGIANPKVELSVDAPLLVKGRALKGFTAEREDGSTKVSYFLTLPSSTPAGDYNIKATLTYKTKSWTVSRKVRVNRATDAAAPNKTSP